MYRTSPRRRRRLSASRLKRTRARMVPLTLLASLPRRTRASMDHPQRMPSSIRRRMVQQTRLKSSRRPQLRTRRRLLRHRRAHKKGSPRPFVLGPFIHASQLSRVGSFTLPFLSCDQYVTGNVQEALAWHGLVSRCVMYVPSCS
jgi:hypothetical protein